MNNMTFTEIEDTNIPGVYMEIDNSLSSQGLSGKESVGLLIGQKLEGFLEPNVLSANISSPDQVIALAGAGSELHRMAIAWKKQNKYNRLYLICPNQAEGTAAVYNVKVTAQDAKDGMVNMLIGGRKVTATVSENETAADIVTALIKNINDNALVPAIAAAVEGKSGEFSLTAKHKGQNGNYIDIRFNYYDGETTAEGVKFEVSQTAQGSGNVSLENVIAGIGDAYITAIASSYTDAQNLKLLEQEAKRRFNAMINNETSVYGVLKGNLSEIITAKGNINNPCVSLMMDYKSPNMPEERAAAYAAVSALEYQKDPARQIASLELVGDLPAKTELMRAERNMLLESGIATVIVNASGNTAIEREATTYRHNALGVKDKSYFDMPTTQTLIYLRHSYVERICNKYQRYKLADDSYEVQPGQKIVTPRVLKGEIIALAEDWLAAGLVENIDEFKKTIVSMRDSSNRERINQLLQPDIINNLRIVAGILQWIL